MNYSVLEHLSIHVMAPLFNKTMENLVVNFSSSSSSNDDKGIDQIIHIMDLPSSTHYLELQQPIKNSEAILDLCLTKCKEADGWTDKKYINR